uniref:Rho GTPase-activating protein 20 n=1 Tax=Scleropages formosus TaxID=113540 RepID=A0A8C9VCE7_SCLFO
MKSLTQRRQSAPSLVISKALTRTRTVSRESCFSPVSPEACPLVQSFLGASRTFLTHSHVQLKTGLQTQERHLFLFTDILLIAKAKSSTHFKLKTQARVSEMWTASCMEEVCEGSTHPERSFVMGWPTCNCVATFSSAEQKDRWLYLIQSRMKQEKDKDDPKTVPLKIFAKDVGNCAYSKTLAVSNYDSTSDVIRMALQQFGILASERDYQLWVSSRRDAAPYPLIGHEFPFSIKMSHIRDPLPQTGGGKDAVTPPGLQGALLLEQLPLHMQCQFILKPSRSAAGQSLTDHGPKPFRRKRSLLSWAFWRGSTSQLDEPPPSPAAPATGRLFGLPLSAVCQDNALPKPIMDMLEVLFHQGPQTKGIFRRSASAKLCRELRDKLNLGAEDVQLSHESIFVTAAVFKEFLRNIPGSLLSQDLYDQWVGVLEQSEGEEEQVQAVQRLVRRLPAENQLLLRHVLAVLHCVGHNSSDNQMNAFNLSVCIAPSMLWAPAPCSPEAESEGTKKKSLIYSRSYSSCRCIARVSILMLPLVTPTDVSSFQMNDSSYDSLENELNDDTESPFQDLCRRRDKQDNWSRDSVITLSDCDLDQADSKPEPDPEPDLLQLPPLVRPRKFTPVLRQPRTCLRPQGDLSSQDLLSPSTGRRLRRCSEPTLGHSPSSSVAHLLQHPAVIRKASYDAVTAGTKDEEDPEEEVFVGHMRRLHLETRMDPDEIQGNGRKVLQIATGCKLNRLPPLRLDASCSSLSSPATSPSASSMSSLDSAFSQYSTDYALFAAIEPCGSAMRTQGSTSPRSPSLSTSSPASSGHAPIPIPQPREVSDWAQHRTAYGLHPNSWLKKDNRLSLLQPDHSGHEGLKDQDLCSSPGSGPLVSRSPGAWIGLEGVRKAQDLAHLSKRRSSCPPSYQQAILQIQHLRSPFYRAKDKGLTVKELRQLHDQATQNKSTVNPRSTESNEIHRNTSTGSDRSHLPQEVFYGQSPSCLTLQKETVHSPGAALAFPRRASEPAVIHSSGDGAPSAAQEGCPKGNMELVGRSVQHCGLRVSDVDLVGDEALGHETRFCLSPSATKAVKEYFSVHGDQAVCLRQSQEVAMAIVQGKREWQGRRCSDPRFEDLDQMLFAEESYV